MNSDNTIALRMSKAGLPYEITGSETPHFLMNGGRSVVALWKDSTNDNCRAFAGFYNTQPDGEVSAQKARRLKGCYAAYVVTAESVD